MRYRNGFESSAGDRRIAVIVAIVFVLLCMGIERSVAVEFKHNVGRTARQWIGLQKLIDDAVVKERANARVAAVKVKARHDAMIAQVKAEAATKVAAAEAKAADASAKARYAAKAARLAKNGDDLIDRHVQEAMVPLLASMLRREMVGGYVAGSGAPGPSVETLAGNRLICTAAAPSVNQHGR